MEHKKSNKANLENKRGIFLQIGLVVVLGITLAAFEWSSKPNMENTLGNHWYESEFSSYTVRDILIHW